jgi:hypothetical protein
MNPSDLFPVVEKLYQKHKQKYFPVMVIKYGDRYTWKFGIYRAFSDEVYALNANFLKVES